MRIIILLIICLSTQFAIAQTANDVTAPTNQTLKERFSYMKTKAQTYQDYKVIKETVLDGIWKIIQDSLVAKQTALRSVKADVSRLKIEVDKLNLALQQKDQSMAEVNHDSSHIRALGIEFQKGSFLTLVVILFLGLLAALGLIMARLKLMHTAIKEKTELFDIVSKEYEEYKRKALDKQTKLSRELQDERNKMHR
jgi:hypothetical protein